MSSFGVCYYAFAPRITCCRYYSPTNGTWTERGVYLRGVAWDGSIALAICVSTHLTLFTVQDKSDVELAVEQKIATLATRFDQLGDVDLLDDSTEINYLVPVIFSAVTIVFVLVVVIAKTRGRASAVDAARKLYVCIILFGWESLPAVQYDVWHTLGKCVYVKLIFFLHVLF